jgi:hypothetical protein
MKLPRRLVYRVVDGEAADLIEVVLDAGKSYVKVVPDGFLDACGRERRLVTRTRERYADIRARLDENQSISAISRATGLDRKTVQRVPDLRVKGRVTGACMLYSAMVCPTYPPPARAGRPRRRPAPRRCPRGIRGVS